MDANCMRSMLYTLTRRSVWGCFKHSRQKCTRSNRHLTVLAAIGVKTDGKNFVVEFRAAPRQQDIVRIQLEEHATSFHCDENKLLGQSGMKASTLLTVASSTWQLKKFKRV